MNFYIKTLKLWFSTHRQPKEYEFHPDKVNVITGDSSTGKSSILQIIDYCLLSENSRIVEDVINENVSWYGLVFNINGKDYALARKAPKDGVSSYDFFWQECCCELPDETPVATVGMGRANIEARLDETVGITDKMIIGHNQKNKLHLRHLLPLSYLSEDIIATMGNYFDFEYLDERLDIEEFKSILRFVIGSDDRELQVLNNQLNALNKAIHKEEKHKKNDESNRKLYEKRLAELKEKAMQLRLINIEQENIDEKVLIVIVQQKIRELYNLKRSHKKLEKIGELFKKRNELKMEVDDYRRLQLEYNRAVRYAQNVKDSMMPMDFLLKNLNRQILTEETLLLYKSLESTFMNLKTRDLVPDKLPDDFQKSREMKQKELDMVDNEIARLDELSKQSVNPDILVKYFQLDQDLKAMKKVEAKFKGEVELRNMNDQLNVINGKINTMNERINDSLKDLDSEIQTYYEEQTGISFSYSNCTVHFNVDRLNVELRREGKNSIIKNVGSKSNYMFMHLCFYLGLHQYLLLKENNLVPSFLLVDQPSIPYYSGTKQIEGNELNDRDDVNKLKSAFRLMDSFMRQNVSVSDNKHF
ncbi:MAG: DUF3732 domain-containing protein, partial [Prevotellaceae bacterium]|nr:DUF3732 domain-containing protein [Prevotellaceae bacterium]